jgi:hypothetical protein
LSREIANGVFSGRPGLSSWDLATFGARHIAAPQLLYPEPVLSSAFFFKKEAPFAKSQRARELWNRSAQLSSCFL